MSVRPTAQSAVALGGGHGLHASLSALRRLHDDLTLDQVTAASAVGRRTMPPTYAVSLSHRRSGCFY